MGVRKVTESKSQQLQGKWTTRIDNSGNGNTVRNTSVRIVNAIHGVEMDKIAALKLRDVGKLYHLEDEAEITQNESTDLESRKEVGNKEEKEQITKLKEAKEKEKADLNLRIKILGREIEKNDLQELIIDRSGNIEGVNNQMDISANEFQKAEGNKGEFELAHGGEEEIIPIEAEIGNQLLKMEAGNTRRAERPNKEKTGKALPWKVDMDLSGKPEGEIRRNQFSEIRKMRIWRYYGIPSRKKM